MRSDIKDIDTRARKLVEAEELAAQERAERESEQANESRIMDARRRIKEGDAKVAAEQARREAGAEAREIARQRYELEERFEAEAMSMNRTLSELQSVHERHADALRRAGRPLGHGYRLPDLIARRWRQLFGGWNSVTGTPSPHFNSEDKPLHEADPMASPRL